MEGAVAERSSQARPLQLLLLVGKGPSRLGRMRNGQRIVLVARRFSRPRRWISDGIGASCVTSRFGRQVQRHLGDLGRDAATGRVLHPSKAR